jgi:hypothetical protein
MTTTAAPRAYRSSVPYSDRAGKAAYIADKYAPVLGGSVLDVGCDEAPLRALVGRPGDYVGVDICANADLRLDLDREDLPFADRSFDTVVCTDVLEHLERCHAVFDELCRVARGHVLASLPNPLRVLLDSLATGGSGKIKYYGLPLDRPPDRHRWFFGHEEAVAFLTGRAQRNGFVVEQLDAEDGPTPCWRGKDGADLLDIDNARGGTIWCLLRRAGA